jgi:hypothetical protein
MRFSKVITVTVGRHGLIWNTFSMESICSIYYKRRFLLPQFMQNKGLTAPPLIDMKAMEHLLVKRKMTVFHCHRSVVINSQWLRTQSMTYRSILPLFGNESQFHYWMHWSIQFISIWTPSFVNIQCGSRACGTMCSKGNCKQDHSDKYCPRHSR